VLVTWLTRSGTAHEVGCGVRGGDVHHLLGGCRGTVRVLGASRTPCRTSPIGLGGDKGERRLGGGPLERCLRLGRQREQQPSGAVVLAIGQDRGLVGRDALARRVRALLARHRKRAVTAEMVLTALRSEPLTLAPGSLEAVLFHVASLLPQLRATQAEHQRCRRRLTELCRRAGRRAEIVDSHRGADVIVTAKLLAEAPQALAACDLQLLRVLAGTAPVTRRSGKSHRVLMRRGCNTRLRDAVPN
jgi:hypothetical protein